MRVWVRLAVLAVLLAGLAVLLVQLRADTVSAGNRLHALYGRKRRLEKTCWELHLSIAEIKTPQRLRDRAATFRAENPPAPAPVRSRGPTSLAQRPGRPDAAGRTQEPPAR